MRYVFITALMCASAFGQSSFNSDTIAIVPAGSEPSGSCSANGGMKVYAGSLYVCDTTWKRAILAGTGIAISGNTISIGPAGLLKAELQSGAALLCTGSASATASTCTMSPTLTTYTSGMLLLWKAGATNSSGAITLAIDSLPSPKSIKKIDGTTDPATNSLVSGQYYLLAYDGTVWRVIAGLESSSATTYANSYTEHFFPALTTDGGIGAGGWRKFDGAGTGAISVQAGAADHWGIYRYTSGSTANNNGGINQYLTANQIPDLSATSGWRITYKLKTSTVADSSYRVGVGNTGILGNDSFGAWYDTNDSDTNWEFRMCASATCGTNVDSGVALADNTWYTIVFECATPGTVTMSVNGSSPVSKSANFPTSGLSPTFGVVTRASATRAIDVDYFKLEWN